MARYELQIKNEIWPLQVVGNQCLLGGRGHQEFEGPFKILHKTDRIIVAQGNSKEIRCFGVNGNKFLYAVTFVLDEEGPEIEIEGYKFTAKELRFDKGYVTKMKQLSIKINDVPVKIATKANDFQHDKVIIFEKQTQRVKLVLPASERFILMGQKTFIDPKIYKKTNQEVFIESAKNACYIKFVRGMALSFEVVARTQNLAFILSPKMEVLELKDGVAKEIGYFMPANIKVEIDGDTVNAFFIDLGLPYMEKYKVTRCLGKTLRYLKKPRQYNFGPLQMLIRNSDNAKLALEKCDELAIYNNAIYFLKDGKPMYLGIDCSIYKAIGNPDITQPIQILVSPWETKAYNLEKEMYTFIDLPLAILKKLKELPHWERL